MPGWIPTSIGLQGMMDQVSASTEPTFTSDNNSGALPPGFGGDPTPSSGSGDGIGGALGSVWQSFIGRNQDLGWLFGQLGQVFQGSSGGDLATQIMKRELEKGVPYHQAALVAANAAQRAQTDSNYRQQLAGWLGWNTKNDHVQYWIQNGGGVPADPTSTAPPAGSTQNGTGTTPSPSATAATGAGTVPFPFPYAQFADPSYRGYNYGDPAPPNSYKSGWHEGQDYGVAAGTTIASPFYARIKNVGYDPAGYGNYVDVQFGDQGMYLRFSHLQYVNVKVGDTVQPGQQVGVSGSTGYSTGPHLLVELRDAQNRPRDPRPLLSEIYGPSGQGVTFAALQQSGLAAQLGATGTVVSGGYPQPGAITTPDGHVLFQGTPDYGYYQLIDAVYREYYANDPPFSIVMAMRAAGVTNQEQMRALAATWPSDIPGVSFGQRDNIYTIANGLATKQWGRPIPDSLVKMLAQQGLTSADDIKLWFDSHMPSQMPVDEYQQLYDAAAPSFNTIYGEPPNPAYIGYLWGQASTPPGTAAGSTPATTPPAKAGTTQ